MRGAELVSLERAALGFDHTLLTQRLLKDWRLPQPLVAGVVHCETPQSIEELPEGQQNTARAVCCAELLAQLLVDGRAAALSQLLEFKWRQQPVSEDRLQAFIDETLPKVTQLADALGAPRPEAVDCQELICRAHAELAAIAAQVAQELITPCAATSGR